MDDFLRPVKTVRGQPKEQSDLVQPVATIAVPRSPASHATANTPEEALECLRSQPDTEVVLTILTRLSCHSRFYPPFTLHSPGHLSAHIINALLSKTVPSFWCVFGESEKALLVSCLSNATGVSAVIGKLRALVSQSGSQKDGLDAQTLRDVLDVALQLFKDDGLVLSLWNALNEIVSDSMKRNLAWRELVNLIGSGKVVAAVAHAEDVLATTSLFRQSRRNWLASGAEYTAWLGRSVAIVAVSELTTTTADSQDPAAQLLLKGLSLGYSTAMVKGLIPALVREAVLKGTSEMRVPVNGLPQYARQQFLDQTLRWLSTTTTSHSSCGAETNLPKNPEVSAIAALLSALVNADAGMRNSLLALLVDPVSASFLSLQVRRACLAMLWVETPDEISTTLEKIMTGFGDPLFINHAPLIQQECWAETLLIAAGYLHRSTPMALLMIARSSAHLQGVSNRLESSSQKARWLGMIVGTALSDLVDKDGGKMNFGTDEMQTKETKWYIELVNVEDELSTLSDFQTLLDTHGGSLRRVIKPQRPSESDKTLTVNGKPVFGPVRPPELVQTEVMGEKVTEILDSDSDPEEDDLKPYAKPDSDPEDSDEDATMVNRNKVRAPVYVRDLMSMLRDDKNHDRFQLGIQQAASLIRRKTHFGAEVKDHANELVAVLCNLHDPFETPSFDELRLQAIIALLLSDVETLAPWLGRQVFAGEYSLAQRCMMLSALGLGGRELGGFDNEDELNPLIGNTDFASKRLPPRLQAIYTNSVKRLDFASNVLEHQLMKPLALHAADQATSQFDAVKVRTFSSRLSTVNRTKRNKPPPNKLAKIFGSSFFYPLVGRYQQDIAAYSSTSLFASTPFLLVTFLKTLALLLHASGPATLDLPRLTIDFWELLLSLRVPALQDRAVLEALLFSLLTLLEVNTSRQRLAEDNQTALLETQRWVEVVFERISVGTGELAPGNGNDEEAKVRSLAAGVLMKIREVVEVYQKEAFGFVVG